VFYVLLSALKRCLILDFKAASVISETWNTKRNVNVKQQEDACIA